MNECKDPQKLKETCSTGVMVLRYVLKQINLERFNYNLLYCYLENFIQERCSKCEQRLKSKMVKTDNFNAGGLTVNPEKS